MEISLLPICKDISLSACAFLYLLSVSLCRLDRAMPSFDSSVLSLILEAFPGGTEFILGGGGVQVFNQGSSSNLRKSWVLAISQDVRLKIRTRIVS